MNRRWRLSSALVVVGVVGGAGWLWWQRAPSQTRAVQACDGLYEELVVAPQDPLERFETLPFCNLAFNLKFQPGPVLEAELPNRAEMRFYVQDQVPLQAEWEARFPYAVEAEVQWKLNDQDWLSSSLSGEWRKVSGAMPPQGLHLGRNGLAPRMEFGHRIQLRHFHLRPLEAPSSPQAPPPSAPASAEEVLLPLGQSLSLPLQSQTRSELEWSALEEDCLPGVAPQERPSFTVRLRGPGVDWSQTLAAPAGPGRVRLPYAKGVCKLQLMAHLPQAPLPGQKGLRLRQPQLHLEPPAIAQRPPRPRPTPTTPPPTTPPPNVVVYLIDTLRADHLGCYGYRPSPSPHLDALAAESVLFEDMTAQSGWTKASTASIMTSQWPWLHGAQDFADRIADSCPTLAEQLQKGGYQTGALVTNYFAGSDFGFERGFDNFQLLGGVRSEEVQVELEKWLSKRDPQRPYFLYVHTLDPHTPYLHSPEHQGQTRAQAKEDDHEVDRMLEQSWSNRCQGKDNSSLQSRLQEMVSRYDHEIHCNDESLGRLVNWLKQHGQYDNTLLIVLSDHGEEFLDHGHMGHINSLYQELLHVPCLMKFPQARAAGRRVGALWQHIDVAPTILGVCGLPSPSAFRGQAFDPDQGPSPRPAYFSLMAGRDAARFGQSEDPRYIEMRGMRQDRWVYHQAVACNPGQELEPEALYDLQSDPRETNNQALQEVGEALFLRIDLESMLRGPVLPTNKAVKEQLRENLRSLQYLR